MNTKTITTKSALLGVFALALVIGGVGGSILRITSANAQTGDADLAVANAPSNPPVGQQIDPSKGGHVGANGKKEELLTGDTAEKAKAAALAAVPGGTIERVETDAEGATYEAHMKKTDGSRVTVKLDESFKVTSTDAGMH